MTEASDLTASVGPDDVVAPVAVQTEGQAESQTAEPTPEGEGEDDRKSEAAKRREREKAHKERLRQEAEEARLSAERAEARRLKIIEAGKNEKPPAESDFTDYAEYVAAKAVWTAEQRTIQRQAEAFGEEAETAKQQAEIIKAAEAQLVQQQWADKVADAKSRYSDFEQVALSNDVPITPQVAEMLMASDKGADLAYYLGTHKAVAAELAALSKTSPVQAAWALGRLEATLSLPAPRTVSQTPDPIAPARGRASANPDPAKMSMEEYARWRSSRK